MTSVFVLGLALVDFIHYVQQIPRGGIKHRSLDAEVCGGGTGANAAVAVSRLGGRASLGSRIGEDLIAEVVIGGLREESVVVDFVQRSHGANSPFSSVFVDRFGERQIVSYRGCGLSEDTGWLKELPEFDSILADLRWPQALDVLLPRARRRGIPAIIDAERSVHLDFAWTASHIAFSSQGIQHLTGKTDVVAALREVAAGRSNWICVTDGENGVYRSKRGRIEHVPAFPIDAKNTLGAGDVWHGAFALRLGEGADEDDAVIFANAAAAIKCSRIEGRSSFPRRAELALFLNEGR